MDVHGDPGKQAERIDLARRSSIRFGATRIEPSLRRLEAKSAVTLEPRVMQVLVALHDAETLVVSRERLVQLCWAGVVVGDDAINRAIMELRRAAAKVGADFEIETIPRIGYRLKATGPWSPGTIVNVKIQALRDEALGALRAELPVETRRAIGLLEQAMRRSPGNAEIVGWSAMAWRNVAEFAPSDEVSLAVENADRLAREALRIYPDEGHALTALATLQPYMGDWIDFERKLLAILDVAPATLPALSHLTTLYQSSGLLQRSKQINDRALTLDPLSPVFLFRDALKRWIFHDIAAADMAIDRVIRAWPRHPAVWHARLMLYAYTGRPQAGLDLLENRALGPAVPPDNLIKLWQTSLAAIATRAPQDIERAVAANLAGVRAAEAQAVTAMLTLSTLGRLDEAFAVARGYFLGQGKSVARAFAADQLPLADQLWKRSMMLFTPAALAMRQDPRFAALCADIGLERFWDQPGNAPDYTAFDQVP